MSKPDKYKTAAEKGVNVPGTSNNDSGWKPYTIPYTGGGAALKGSDWIPQRRNEIAAPPDFTKSHAAPPLYVAGERKTQLKNSEKGQQQQKQAEGSGSGAGTQKKTAATENDMFHATFPLGAKREDPKTRK